MLGSISPNPAGHQPCSAQRHRAGAGHPSDASWSLPFCQAEKDLTQRHEHVPVSGLGDEPCSRQSPGCQGRSCELLPLQITWPVALSTH